MERLLSDNEDIGVRLRAIDALRGDTSAVQPLAQLLHDDDIDVREAALSALQAMPDAAMPAVLDAIFLPRLATPMVEALERNPDSILDLTAPLLTAYSEVTYAAMGAFGRLVTATAPFCAALHSPVLAVRRAAAQICGQRGAAEAVEPLIAALREEPTAWGRHAIIEALGALGDARAVPPLLAVFRRGEKVLRGTIAAALSQLGDERAIEPLIGAITRWGMGWSIASALAGFGDRVVVPISEALMKAKPRAQRHLVLALGWSGSPRAVDALLAAANALPDLEARRAVGAALGSLGDARAVHLLLRWLEAPEAQLRLGAAEAFQSLPDPRATDGLRALLEDEDAEVVAAARLALAAAP